MSTGVAEVIERANRRVITFSALTTREARALRRRFGPVGRWRIEGQGIAVWEREPIPEIVQLLDRSEWFWATEEEALDWEYFHDCGARGGSCGLPCSYVEEFGYATCLNGHEHGHHRGVRHFRDLPPGPERDSALADARRWG